MGYIRHHAILVTTWDEKRMPAAFTKAVELGCKVTPVVESGINGYQSFFVAPDGSKEGRPYSDEGDAQRHALIEWLLAQEYDDGSNPFDWAEVQYGDDDGVALVTTHDSDPLRHEHESGVL